MEDKNKFVDELLDSALAHQPKPEPGHGFEAHIVGSVRAHADEQSARKKPWKFRAAAVATAIAVLVIAAIYVATRSHGPALKLSTQAGNAVPAPAPSKNPPIKAEATPQPGSKEVVAANHGAARRETKPAHRAKAPHWPSQFPTPAPLSPEERTLIQLVRDTPPKVLAALSKQPSQSVEVKPLKIPPLEIKPLAAGTAEEAMQ